jgi:hypothetical protein
MNQLKTGEAKIEMPPLYKVALKNKYKVEIFVWRSMNILTQP